MPELLLKDEVYAIVGAAMEVHRENGPGFSEAIYQECLQMELAARQIPFAVQKELPFYYKGQLVDKTYIADLVAYDKIIVELKALDRLTPREESQVINYLKVSKMQVGVLINFGASSLEWKRMVLSRRPTETVEIDLHSGAKNNSRQFA